MFHLGWSTMLVLAVGVQLSLKTIHYICVTASACTEVSAKNGEMTNPQSPLIQVEHICYL